MKRKRGCSSRKGIRKFLNKMKFLFAFKPKDSYFFVIPLPSFRQYHRNNHAIVLAKYLNNLTRRMIITLISQQRRLLLSGVIGAAALAVFFLTACDSRSPKAVNENPGSAAVFDVTGSDAKAIALADSVMAACGGRENWERTHFITWDWFGKRLTVWDKWTGDLRIESRRSLVLMNLNTMKGRAWKDGHEWTEPADLKRAFEYGFEAWANDSYWMLLPFKLKDAGVTLKYVREDTTGAGEPADVLSLTFNNVGLTPQNKHYVYVAKASKLLVQWDFFTDARDSAPHFWVPWKNYQKFGHILLSNDRGDGPRKIHVGLGVYEALPASVFNDPEPIDWARIKSEFGGSEETQIGSTAIGLGK